MCLVRLELYSRVQRYVLFVGDKYKNESEKAFSYFFQLIPTHSKLLFSKASSFDVYLVLSL